MLKRPPIIEYTSLNEQGGANDVTWALAGVAVLPLFGRRRRRD